MSGSAVDPNNFVAAVKPLLERRDLEGLLAYLSQHWTPDSLVALLSHRCCDARKVAALSLSLVGGKCCIPHLVERLKDPDPVTNQMAEHALWSIWFRSSCPSAAAELAKGADCLTERHFDCAFKHFNRAIELAPDFAEAYNQRAIAYYLLEDYESCLMDCKRAIKLMPCHFGAWAGLGHCYVYKDELARAIECYEKALEINPHLDSLRQAIEDLRGQLDPS